MNVFPNPNNGHFTIDLSDTKSDASVTIIDGKGNTKKKQSLQAGENKVDSKDLPSGTYLLMIDIGGTKTIEKIVISK